MYKYRLGLLPQHFSP